MRPAMISRFTTDGPQVGPVAAQRFALHLSALEQQQGCLINSFRSVGRQKTVKAGGMVGSLIDGMMPVAEMGYTQVLPVASAK